MDRALVVVRSGEDRSVLRTAAALAGGVGADLVVLSLLSPDEFDRDVEVLDAIDSMEGTQSGDPTEEELAAELGEEMATAALEESTADVDVDIVGAVAGSNQAETVLDAAEDTGSDHLFIAGSERSPAGKALFGDLVQSVVKTFDGNVTVCNHA